jgi:hypothetical protein
MHTKQHRTYEQAPRIAIWIGIALLLLGLASRYVIGVRGVSSLNPMFLGMAVALLGFLALEPEYARGAMRGITGLAALGTLITLHVLPQVYALLNGQQFTGDPMVFGATTAMLLLCGTLLGVCIGAFSWARYRRVHS